MCASHQKHQHELSRLQDLLREKNKENKRLKSNFESIKDLNDNMKKQVGIGCIRKISNLGLNIS